jgi:hypothetical protein
MTDLRTQLENARRTHREQKYPGDLGELALRPTPSRFGWLISAAGIAAAAAVLIVGIVVQDRDARVDSPIVINISPETVDPAENYSEFEIASAESTDETADVIPDTTGFALPTITAEIDFAPAVPDFSFSVPSFFASDTDESNTTTTSEESV